MGKISDIWVKLGLKKDEFDKGMDDAVKKTNKTGGNMSKMLDSAKAGWAAVGAVVLAFGQQMITATNKVGDAWSNTMAGIKSGWHQMLANVSNVSWKDLLKSMNLAGLVVGGKDLFKKIYGGVGAAAEAGAEMAAAFDAEFELTRSLAIQREKIKGELADLRVMMANTTLSSEERRAAGERYKALLEPLYEAEIAVREDMLDKAVTAWLAGTGVDATTEQVKDFFTYIGTDAAAMAKKYPELARVFNDMKGDETNQPLFDAIAKLTAAQNGLANELKEVNTTLNSLKDVPALLKAGMADVSDVFKTSLELPEIEELDIAPDVEYVDEVLGSITDGYAKMHDDIIAFNNAINDSIENTLIASMSNGLQAITDMMFGLEGADMKNALAAFIAPLGDTMKQMGAMIMSEGIAMTAFKASFKNPAAAIAAGAALIAVGSAVSSGLQRLTANPGGGTGYSSGSSASAGVRNYESEMTIYVEGKISGSDIVLAGNKTLKNWRR